MADRYAMSAFVLNYDFLFNGKWGLANEWPDYRSSGSSYNQQSQQQPNQQQQSGKPNANGGKGYSVASTHDYLGYGSSNGQRQEKGYQQELWDDDKEGDLW